VRSGVLVIRRATLTITGPHPKFTLDVLTCEEDYYCRDLLLPWYQLFALYHRSITGSPPPLLHR